MAMYTSMALKATQGGAPIKYLGVINDGSENQGYLEYSAVEVLSPNAKFAVEYARDDLVHIRSCLTNKYWVRSTDGDWIVAQGSEPVVNQALPTCTLFRIVTDVYQNVKFYHVQSGRTICIPAYGSARKMFLTINPVDTTEAMSLVVDYDTLVVLPKFVAFKGSNGMYCKYNILKNYSDFSANDIGDLDIVCEIRNTSDGQINVRAINAPLSSPCFLAVPTSPPEGKLVWEHEDPKSRQRIFDAIMINRNEVALRNLANKKFCMRADFVKKNTREKDCLVTGADGMIKDTYLEVVEPVNRRTVNVYEFDLKNARIYNVTLIYSQEHVWDNYTDVEQSGSAKGIISTTKTQLFSNSITVSGTFETTFEAGVPFIAKGEIKVSASGGFTRQWGQTEVEVQQLEHTFDVVLKANMSTIARGIATKASCDVPFAYVQKDYPADGGPPRIIKLHDGVFTGTNAYSFRDDVRYEKLPTYTGPRDEAPSMCIKRPVVVSDGEGR